MLAMSQGNANSSADPVPASSSKRKCLCQSMSNNPIFSVTTQETKTTRGAAGWIVVMLHSPASVARGKIAREKYFTIHKTSDMFVSSRLHYFSLSGKCSINGRADLLEYCLKEIP